MATLVGQIGSRLRQVTSRLWWGMMSLLLRLLCFVTTPRSAAPLALPPVMRVMCCLLLTVNDTPLKSIRLLNDPARPLIRR